MPERRSLTSPVSAGGSEVLRCPASRLPRQSEASRGAAANDVNMLVCTGGRQRSEAEFRSLYAAAGFALSRIIPTDMAFASIIEGVPE
jgi:O-methyltransferase domain